MPDVIPGGLATARVAIVAHWDWLLYNFRLPLAERLRARGVDVTFISPPGRYDGALRAAGFRWMRWPVSRRGLNPAAELFAILQLAALYHRYRFDAVHHFTIKPVLYGSLAARLTRTPATINTFTGLGFVFSDNSQARRLRRVLMPGLRRLLHGASVYTVFQTDGDRTIFAENGLIPGDRTEVIPGSGIDVERFSPKPDVGGGGLSTTHAVVLMAGRLLWDKGVAEFVEAARKLSASGLKARFWLAGEADHGNPRYVPAGALDRWRDEGVVEFLGHRLDMAELLAEVSIAVLPSYHEGVPRFLLEAAAAGLPLIASDIDGCRAVVRDGINGLLVPPKDPTALAGAIARLVADPELRVRMGRASRTIAVTDFEEDVILDRFEAVYRRMGVVR